VVVSNPCLPDEPNRTELSFGFERPYMNDFQPIKSPTPLPGIVLRTGTPPTEQRFCLQRASNDRPIPHVPDWKFDPDATRHRKPDVYDADPAAQFPTRRSSTAFEKCKNFLNRTMEHDFPAPQCPAPLKRRLALRIDQTAVPSHHLTPIRITADGQRW
jgi:hypothetical protein